MSRILLPQAFPYDGGLVSYGAACKPPAGEPRWGSFQFDWANVTVDRPGYIVDMTQYPNMPNQLATLFVDNSRSHQAVSIIFPDTGFTVIVDRFKRGFYQVLTKSAQFFIGIPDAANSSNDHTFLGACDFFVPPQENEVSLERISIVAAFDPAATVGPTTLIDNTATGQFSRLRGGYAQASNMTGGGGGWLGRFELLADGVPVVTASATIFATGFLDMGFLWQTNGDDPDIAAVLWEYQFTLVGGGLTGPGLVDVQTYLDLCQGL